MSHTQTQHFKHDGRFLRLPVAFIVKRILATVNARILLHNMIIRWCEDVDGTVDFLTTENMSNEEYSTLSLPNIAERVSMVTDVCHIRNNDPNNLNIH
jgi:hypothetical protein